MLARITYALVGLALVTLIVGFFQRSSNTFLYTSIALSLVAIGLVVVAAARSVSAADPAFLGDDEDEEELPLSPALAIDDEEDDADADEAVALDADEEEYEDEEYEDEEYEDEDYEDEDELVAEDEEFDETEEPEEDEEPEEVPVAPRRGRSAAATRSRAPAAKAATKAAPKSKAKPKAAASSRGKVLVVPGRDRYHTADCRFIADKDDIEELTSATAKRRGYQACSVCKP